MKQVIKEYRIELFALLVVLLGIFTVGDFSIRYRFMAFLGKASKALIGGMGQGSAWIANQAVMLTPGDFFGGFMAAVAAGFIVWRIRYRFRHDQRWSLDYCPRCSNPIVRVHRKLMDRFLGVTLLPEARRYSCMNPQCSWTGLRRRGVHQHASNPDSVPAFERPQ